MLTSSNGNLSDAFMCFFFFSETFFKVVFVFVVLSSIVSFASDDNLDRDISTYAKDGDLSLGISPMHNYFFMIHTYK